MPAERHACRTDRVPSTILSKVTPAFVFSSMIPTMDGRPAIHRSKPQRSGIEQVPGQGSQLRRLAVQRPNPAADHAYSR
jgi:hypothetical protein